METREVVALYQAGPYFQTEHRRKTIWLAFLAREGISLTTQQAAERLGVPTNSVQRQCKRWKHRTIPATDGTSGRRYVYDISEDELFLFSFAMRRAIRNAQGRKTK
jgi:hypothetical protein